MNMWIHPINTYPKIYSLCSTKRAKKETLLYIQRNNTEAAYTSEMKPLSRN